MSASLQLYSIAGALFLFIKGQFFFFNYPEWYAEYSETPFALIYVYRFIFGSIRQIYGGIAMGVAACAILNILALSNVSSARFLSVVLPYEASTALLHLDPSLQVHLAVSYRDIRHPSCHYISGTPERVGHDNYSASRIC